jgi:uncharacterized membrane protein YphA (DoxX/SURF4 family)
MRRSLLGPNIDTLRHWLAFLRIVVGALYLCAFASKIGHGFVQALPQQLRAFSAQNRFDFSRRVLEHMAAHPQVFGWMVLIGEFSIGVLLLLGLGTRLVALVALALQVVYLLAALGGNIVVTLANALFVAALLVILGTEGGWCWSLDEMIVNRR